MDDDLLTADDVAGLAERMHGYAECEGFRLAYRWLCETVAQTLEAALEGEVDPDLAGEIVDLWCEVSEREIVTEGSC